MSETVKLHAADGHELSAYVSGPEGTPKAAVVVVQEIFGVNHHIRAVADRLASQGYLAVAPALFDRYQRDFEVGYDPESVQKAMAIVPKLNMEWAAADTLAAVEYGRDEYKTEVGIVGFCLGGSIAWMAAAKMPVSAAVGYYGGQISRMNDLAPRAPVLLYFGTQDEHITMSDVDEVKAAHPDVPIHLFEAGHGFSCDERASYDPSAAEQAWAQTLAFLGENLVERLDNTEKEPA